MVTLSREHDPGAPFVTYYDASTGERTELSSTSLANWQAKTANYLRDGLGIDQGARIALLLPLHWVVPIWLAAARSVGATIELASATEREGSPDVSVFGPTALETPPTGDELIACSLLPLAQPFSTPLPPGIEDYFSEVRVYADQFLQSAIAPDVPVMTCDGTGLTGDDLARVAADRASAWDLDSGARLLLTAPDSRAQIGGCDSLLALYDVPRALGGSVVVVQGFDADATAEIARQERITHALTI